MPDKHDDETDSPDKETVEPIGSFINGEFAGRHGTVASQSPLEDAPASGTLDGKYIHLPSDGDALTTAIPHVTRGAKQGSHLE